MLRQVDPQCRPPMMSACLTDPPPLPVYDTSWHINAVGGTHRIAYVSRAALEPGCVETARDCGPGGFRPGRCCFRIPKLGASGCGDASVHRRRRSDATDAATKQP